MHKAQTYSFDLMIALSIFIAIFLIVSDLWDHSRNTIGESEKRNELEDLSRYALSGLLVSSGSPSDWYSLSSVNRTNVQGLGLMSRHYGYISEDKLSAFISMNSTSYQSYKELLGMRGPYEFYMNISRYDSDFNCLSSDSVGVMADCTSVVRLHRVAILDTGDYVILDFRGCMI